MQRVKWATARVLFLIVTLAGTASGGVVSYLLGPLYSWYLFNDPRFLKYHRFTFPLVRAYWKLVFEWLANSDYRRMFAIPWTAPPMIGPDRSLVRISAEWVQSDSACNGCVECCVRRACPMLDRERHLCRSYGSFFWRYFNCGRYPENGEQIRFYECRKWQVRVGGAP